MGEPTFTEALSVLCSKELSKAEGDADRMGVMIERLAAALGFTIAIAARGRADGIDMMMEGAEGYAHREAVAKAPLARFMAEMRDDKKRNRPPSHREGTR